MQTISKTLAIALCWGASLTILSAQCITDECGDIFADWALVSEQVTICEGSTFEVVNQTTFPDIDFYVWDWGNGERDTVYEVSNYFYTYLFGEDTACSGDDFVVYNISLEIYRFCEEGQSCHTQIAPVAVRFMPRADFELPPIVCASDTVAISNGSCNGDEYFWDFGDGTTSTEVNPGHVFDTSGMYDVTLVVTNQCGTDSISLPVEVLDKPIAGSSANGSDSAIGCVPLTVSFTNASQFSDSFSWSFPDQAGIVFLDTFSSSSPAPTVEFTLPGTYTVSMFASNDCGSNEWTTTVEVLAPPGIALDSLPSGCDTISLSLGDYLSTSGDIDTYNWSISGPQAPSVGNEANPLVSFGAPGNYQVYLTASNAYCPADSDSTTLFLQNASSLALDIAEPDPLCDTSVPIELAATPEGGIWTGPGINTEGLFDPALVGLGSYTLTYAFADGFCLLTDSVEVNLQEGESVTTTLAINDCENAPAIQLDFAPTGGTWMGEGISDPSLGLFDPSLSGAGSFGLTYTYVDDNNCLIGGQTTATIQAAPNLVAPDTAAFCIDVDELLLSDELSPTASPAGGQLLWSGEFITDAITGRFSSPGEGLYGVGLTYTLDLCEVSTTAFLNVIDPEEAIAGPDLNSCISAGSLNLQGAPAGGQWSGPGIVNAFSGEVDLATAGDGEHAYTYTIADGTSCQVSDIMNITVIGPNNLDAGESLGFCVDAGLQELPDASPTGGLWTGPAILNPASGLVDIGDLSANSTFWYTYFIEDQINGCTFSDSVALRVHPLPEASFPVPEAGCVDSILFLATMPADDVTHFWRIDNYGELSGDTVSLNLTEPGTYEVQLYATSSAGCSSVDNQELIINTVPTPAFALDIPIGCGPLSVTFTDSSEGINLSYQWDLGNGQSSSDAEPDAVVYQAGIFDTTYWINLQVSNTCGLAALQDSVVVRARPVADFGTPVSSGCAPLEISFANTTTGNADSYSWDLGNGQSSTDSLPPIQTYSTPDTAATNYTITLIATNTCGSDSIQRSVLVQPSDATPFFNVDNTQGCQPLTVNFTNYANYGATISWDFGDGFTSGEISPSHTFSEPGYYTVYQHAATACGEDSVSTNIEVLPSPSANFTHPSEVCPDQVVEFENLADDFQTVFWDFGDGQVSTAIAPDHYYQDAGEYTVTMVISNTAYGCQATTTSEVTVLERPTASLAVDEVNGCPPLDACFTATSTNADFYEWDFGDGNTTAIVNPCHNYTQPGLYQATLRTADAAGCFSLADTVNIRVFEEPVASFSLPDDLLCGAGQTVAINNNSTDAMSHEWTFGNGSNSQLVAPVVNFSDTGSYVIELLVRNTFGCEATASTNLRILPQPLADFAPILLDACAPQVVIFDNASLNGNSFQWDFGNGQSSTALSPSITYDVAGSYDVNLVVSYDELCYDSLRLNGSVELLERPEAAFNWTSPAAEYDGFIQFTHESSNASSYQWDFGDGSFSEEASPLHDYRVNGNWEASLLAISTNGCTDTAAVVVTPEFMSRMFFPNALSPESGSGDVRVFKPVGIGLANWTLEIFSPWGQRVFLADDLQEDQPAAAWDGTYQEAILPQGAYAYKATVEYLDGVKRIYTGSVTLIR